jgi:adenosylcobinamide-phosphate synthase
VREAAVVLLGAIAFDLVFGEPPARLHPVVWIGRFQSALRRFASPTLAPVPAFAFGLLMALAGPLVFGLGCWWVLSLLAVAAFPLRIIAAIFLLKSAFAARALAAAATAVHVPLARGEPSDLAAARAGLRSLVSRDTAELDASEIAGAAIESVAENASDSVVAPLFYYVVGGVPAALAYRAVNTLDAMIGYRGPTEWLGKAAARLDDAANFIPARLTALLLAAASGAGGGSPARALALWLRDGRKTESPNAGRPMAAMAGALGVELSKRGAYVLGAGMRAPEASDLTRAVRIFAVAAALAFAVAIAACEGAPP